MTGPQSKWLAIPVRDGTYPVPTDVTKAKKRSIENGLVMPWVRTDGNSRPDAIISKMNNSNANYKCPPSFWRERDIQVGASPK